MSERECESGGGAAKGGRGGAARLLKAPQREVEQSEAAARSDVLGVGGRQQHQRAVQALGRDLVRRVQVTVAHESARGVGGW